MLEVRNLSVSYGQHRALDDVSVRVDRGEIVVILGANGAGKSTLLKAISGICEGQVAGSVVMEGHELVGVSPNKIVEEGIALVPEGRGIFADLTVAENLTLGAYSERARDEEEANLERVFSLFPKLVERRRQVARTMSGGEQQMVAIGRAMMSNPAILTLDEPSLGLSPLLCKELFQSLKVVRDAGIGILLVEQNAKQSLAIADRGYLLENAHIVHEDNAGALANDPAVQKAYLGAGGATALHTHEVASAGASPSDIAAAAIANVERVAVPVPSAKSAVTMSADAILGRSVAEMVSSASRQSSDDVLAKRTASVTQPDVSAHGDRLQSTLSEIERAAANARNRRPAVREHLMPMRGHRRAQPATVPTSPPDDDHPVVVEVYRAPRVEVYRRRGDSDEFERN